MRERIITMLFTVAYAILLVADSLRTPENEDKEYKVSVFGHTGDFC